MRMQSISKSRFAGLNDKRCYFYDGIVSMLFGHHLLEKLKKKIERNIYSFAHKGKERRIFKCREAKAVRQCERLRVLRSI